MSFDSNFDLIVRNFVSNFNQMCRATNRDYLIRPKGTKGETNRKNENLCGRIQNENLASTDGKFMPNGENGLFFQNNFRLCRSTNFPTTAVIK